MSTAPDGYHDHTEPTWFNQLFHAHKLFREKGRAEVERHARVSSDNGHKCKSCFCCAAHAVLYDPEQRHRRGLPS